MSAVVVLVLAFGLPALAVVAVVAVQRSGRRLVAAWSLWCATPMTTPARRRREPPTARIRH